MAKNADVLKAFVMGDSKPETKNLYIAGDNLVNYTTVIAKRDRIGRDVKKIYINTTNCSPTTSKILTQLKNIAPAVLLDTFVGEGR